ncbi:S1 family peptidase [Streptomyces peucetius]|uniref:S1 family peptidase n=1 Tax=Streptomyces peucetius TaxID=1950 RepID=A0ABY6I906_STRPE|nr:S1 family peptidase [Streptomyces peucetius]UYQ63479.1 S1 family peptidase [Streptomyces peucetius]
MMHTRRRRVRRKLQRTVRLAAAVGLLSGVLMVSGAVAGEPPPAGGGTPAQADPAADVVSRLGPSRTAGSWTGADGRTVVAVTDQDAAEEARRAGAEAKVVEHSMEHLRSATEALRSAPRVTGTAWSVDYADNSITVRADSTVSAEDWSQLAGLAERIGGFVRMERTSGAFTTRVNGGTPVFGDQRRCSAGFNVTNGRDTFILTAGHCGPRDTTWFRDRAGDELVGTTTASSFPGDDYSLVRYEDVTTLDRTNVVSIGDGRGVRIVGAGEAAVGQRVFRSGSTTGFRSGEVTAVDATVNYPEGTVTGLIETTVCAEPGDSGGPLFSEGLALGVTSGGDGDCVTGGTTYFQPVTTAMESLGVNLTGGPPGPGDADANGEGGAGAPPVPAPPVPPARPEEGIASRTVTAIVDFGDPALGAGLIGVSLTGLLAARRLVSAQERREYRSFHNASWG